MKGASGPPASVNWLGYLAITLLLTLPLAVLTVRSGAWQQGLLMYALSCLGATLVLIVAVLLLLLPAWAEWRPAILKRAAFALPGTLLLSLLIAGRGDQPPIHDITTDTERPPVFTAAEARRGPDSNPLAIDPEVIAQQRAAYPEVQTQVVGLDIDAAFDRALEVAAALGWEIYHQDRDRGVIEAVDTTAVMHFRDDVVIRLRSNAEGTLVDLRSVSRVGVSDLGANAARIMEFQRQFAETLE